MWALEESGVGKNSGRGHWFAQVKKRGKETAASGEDWKPVGKGSGADKIEIGILKDRG